MTNQSLTKEDIQHIANLANLTIHEHEIEKFRDQLSAIISYIGKLNEVNTENVPPTNQVTGLTNKTRPDSVIAADSLSSEEALKNAPQKKETLFQVDAIFDQ